MAIPQWSWARSKDFVTKLQIAPKPPVVVPVVPYPEEEGTYRGNRYYTTAISQTIIDSFQRNYLSFLEESREITLAGRNNKEVRDLAFSITRDKTGSYDKAKAIHHWVYKNVEYKLTPRIVPPWELIKPEVTGDCKAFNVLTASLLGIVNIPCWFKLVKIGDVVTLHVYNLASLTWEVVDGVGAYFLKEAKPIAGYIIYEVDRTASWPPRPLPSGAGIAMPEELKKALPWIGVVGGTIGAVALALWIMK